MMDGDPGRQDTTGPRWWPLWTSVVLGLGFMLAAGLSGGWFLSAFPVGLLFGFFLQKGDLCGASAFSEVLLMRDGRKIFGLWAGIVVSMLGFAGASLSGWVSLGPKPLLWVNDLAGGLIFGAGTVLAGGCISGCLYKSATGNVNSIVALLTIPVGIAFVEHGPLTGWAAKAKAVRSTAAGGGPVTLSSLSGLPFWTWALIFAGATGLIALRARTKRKGQAPKPASRAVRVRFRQALTRPWKPWHAGIAVGLLVVASLFSSAAAGRNYPIGVTHGVFNVHELLTVSNLVHVTGPATTAVPAPAVPGASRISWWLVLVVLGTVIGAFASASLEGRVRLQAKPSEQIVTALFGGFLVGVGAAIATGCVVGNIMSGWPLMSVGMILFGVAVILANWATTYLFMMGGRLADMPAALRLIFKRERRRPR